MKIAACELAGRTGHAAGRELLAALYREETGEALPPIAVGERGKPFFPAHPEVCFSLSHTNGAVLAGVSVAPVGVDIEFDRPVGRRTMERLAGTADRAEFLRWWVRREAAAKRDGAGVAAVDGKAGTAISSPKSRLLNFMLLLCF